MNSETYIMGWNYYEKRKTQQVNFHADEQLKNKTKGVIYYKLPFKIVMHQHAMAERLE